MYTGDGDNDSKKYKLSLKSYETSTKHIGLVICFDRSSAAASRIDIYLHKNMIE